MMKKTIKLVPVVLMLLIGTNAYSQTTPAGCDPYNNTANTNDICENGNGIKTNPANPVNDDCSELENDFEWRVKHVPGSSVPDEHYYAYDGDGILRALRNPFNDPTNSEYRHLANNHGSNYHPEDGWELLKVEFAALSNIGLGVNVAPAKNSDVTGAKLPYMIFRPVMCFHMTAIEAQAKKQAELEAMLQTLLAQKKK